MLIGYTMRFASVAGIRFCELTFRGLFRLAEHKTWRDLNSFFSTPDVSQFTLSSA
jgi:hypothetical protein